MNVSNAIVLLPLELQREIIRFIPRNETAEAMYKSRYMLKLRYVRRKEFLQPLPSCKDNIWEDIVPFFRHNIGADIAPSKLQSMYYGDIYKIIRTDITKGQYIALRKIGILPSGIRYYFGG